MQSDYILSDIFKYYLRLNLTHAQTLKRRNANESEELNMKEIKKFDKKYEERNVLADGTKTKGTVIAIQEGIVNEFISNTEKWQGDVDGPALNLIIKSNDTDKQFPQLLTLPPDGKTISDKSNLFKYKLENGDFPFEGQEVSLIVRNGFERLRL